MDVGPAIGHHFLANLLVNGLLIQRLVAWLMDWMRHDSWKHPFDVVAVRSDVDHFHFVTNPDHD